MRLRAKLIAAGGIVATGAAAALGLFGLRFGYEHASYQVVERREAFEVRRYDPRLVAEVTVAGSSLEDATSRGFRILADYIFGNNTAPGAAEAQAISMTTPVDARPSSNIAMTTPVDSRHEGGEFTIGFTMPSEYQLDTLPRPRDGRVMVREQPERHYAAIRFTGAPSAPVVEERMARLTAAVAGAGLTPRPDVAPVYARYDPPWTPSFLRRNEILVELVQ